MKLFVKPSVISRCLSRKFSVTSQNNAVGFIGMYYTNGEKEFEPPREFFVQRNTDQNKLSL